MGFKLLQMLNICLFAWSLLHLFQDQFISSVCWELQSGAGRDVTEWNKSASFEGANWCCVYCYDPVHMLLISAVGTCFVVGSGRQLPWSARQNDLTLVFYGHWASACTSNKTHWLAVWSCSSLAAKVRWEVTSCLSQKFWIIFYSRLWMWCPYFTFPTKVGYKEEIYFSPPFMHQATQKGCVVIN